MISLGGAPHSFICSPEQGQLHQDSSDDDAVDRDATREREQARTHLGHQVDDGVEPLLALLLLLVRQRRLLVGAGLLKFGDDLPDNLLLLLEPLEVGRREGRAVRREVGRVLRGRGRGVRQLV